MKLFKVLSRTYALFMLSLVTICCYAKIEENIMIFQGKETELETAILNDDAVGVAHAIGAGANPNAQGRHQTTPLEYAIGNLKTQAAMELIRWGANPNMKDAEGDNAVILAVSVYHKAPEIIEMVLQAGGDPNTKLPDNNPILTSFIINRDINGIRYMAKSGADINARDRSNRPLIIKSGILEYWDVVLCLLELGAEYDYSGEPWTLAKAFATPDVTPPDSPLWPYKVKVWNFLHDRGLALPPLK